MTFVLLSVMRPFIKTGHCIVPISAGIKHNNKGGIFKTVHLGGIRQIGIPLAVA